MKSVGSKNSLLVQSSFNWFSLNQSKYCSSKSKQKTNEIKIPNYIPRSKTAILEALESTVKQVPHQLPYNYFHDPFLAPKNQRELKNYALSRESGVKAANYFMKNYPQLFYRDQAEPKIEKFSYPDVFNDQMEFNLDDIQSSIDKRNVSNAIVAYKKLNQQTVEIPLELRLSLFQLVCFFNSKDAFEYMEEQPFTRKMSIQLFDRRNVWDKKGFAEQMWSEFFSKENNEIANSVYIQALIRFGAFDNAYSIYKEFEKDKKKVNLDAFNSLLRALPYINVIKCNLENVEKFLDLINLNAYQPTIETINSALFALNFAKDQLSDIIKFAEKLMLDCKLLGLESNLGTYYYILCIFYKDKNSTDPIIYKIIDKIEKDSFKLTSKEDLAFFDEASRVASDNLSDVQLAIRIFELFQKNNNMYLNIFKESDIYENFFIALAKGASTETLFEYYDKIVPGIFFPSPLLLTTIVDHLIVFNSVNYIDRFFQELDKYSYLNLNNLNNRIFHLILSVPRAEKTDAIFTEFMLKSLTYFSKAQYKMDNQQSIERNVESINALLDHLVFLDGEKETIDFILKNGMEIRLIQTKNFKKFYSKLVRKLLNKNEPQMTIKILRFCIAKGINGLDDDLIQVLNKSEIQDKYVF